MAKKKTAVKKTSRKREVNKSQIVRDYLADHPRAKPKEVSAELAKQGIDVSPQNVSTIKFQAKNRPGGKKRGTRSKARGGSNKVDINVLMEAKKLADKMGGVAQAKRALDILAKIS